MPYGRIKTPRAEFGGPLKWDFSTAWLRVVRFYKNVGGEPVFFIVITITKMASIGVFGNLIYFTSWVRAGELENSLFFVIFMTRTKRYAARIWVKRTSYKRRFIRVTVSVESLYRHKTPIYSYFIKNS